MFNEPALHLTPDFLGKEIIMAKEKEFDCDPEKFDEKYPNAKLNGNLHLGDEKGQQQSVDTLRKQMQKIEQMFKIVAV